MNTIPLVSILVTTYNQEAYIGKTLDSLLMQVCPFDYEILIGEDCSTDQTRAICQKYAQNYPDKIRLFLNEKNKGLINNYFDLMEQAHGTFLADCGGDDCWLTTDKLSHQIMLLEEHPEVSLVCGNWQKYDQNSGALKTNMSGRSEDWFKPGYEGLVAVKDYLNECDFPRVVLGTSLFRNDWMKEMMIRYRVLFRGEKIVCEDLPMTLCLLLKGPVYMMKEQLMVYRVLEKSSSHSESLKDFSYPVFLQTLELASVLGLSINELGPYVKKSLLNLVFSAFETNDKEWMIQIAKDLKKFGIKLSFKQSIQYLSTLNQWIHGLVFNTYRLSKCKRVCTK